MTASPAPGMPSEETIARAMCVVDGHDPDAPYGIGGRTNAWRYEDAARAVAALIRPAFEAKEREIEAMDAFAKREQEACIHWRGEAAKFNEARLSAEAKLAQAVEAMEPFDDVLGEDDEGYGDGLTVVMKWGACTDYSVTLGDLRDLRKAARAAAAMGEKT